MTHPVACLAKKDGTIRLCVDFQHLNSFTVPDAYPMEIMKDFFYETGQADFITTLHLMKVCSVDLNGDESESFTDIVTHSRHYQ